MNDLEQHKKSSGVGLLGLVGGGFLVWAVVCLGFAGTVIYVAAHFIAKLW